MKARMGARVAVALIALVALAGCSSAEPGLTAPKVDFDTPALRVLKKQAGIENCTAPTAAKASGSLPDFTAPCLGGGPKVDLARLRGPLVVNLWAQFCGPCREEMPVLQKFYERFGSKVPVLGIDYTDPQPELALRLARKTGAKYPMVADYPENIRVVGLPTTILIDADGRVVLKRGGKIDSVGQLRDLIAQHLGVDL